jgi:hypothetical protein
MIIKSLSRKSNTDQLVSYIFKYVFKGKEKSIATTKKVQTKSNKEKFIIRHNIRSRSMNGFVKEFKENESFRLVHRKDSVKLYHTIISFSNKDKAHITDNILKDIAKKFIEERGLNNLYAGTKHEDKDHVHLHISVSGTQLNGKSSRVSKQKLHSIKLALNKYQREKYPQLVNSLPEHGKSKRLSKEAVVERIKIERQTDKQTLHECLEKAYSNSKSQEEFLSQLKESGHQPYYRNGALQGIRFEGHMKYRLTRLGFDKARLKELGQIKPNGNKALDELQKLRAGQNKDLRRIIEPVNKKDTQEKYDKNEKQVLEELSDARAGNDNKEIERDEEHTRTQEAEELNNREDEPENNNEEEDDSETEGTI